MDISATGLIDSALGGQANAVAPSVGLLMLRKTLDMASQQMASLIQSVPQLATSGSLGTNINTYA